MSFLTFQYITLAKKQDSIPYLNLILDRCRYMLRHRGLAQERADLVLTHFPWVMLVAK